jgi:hydrogenase 3 maturation protease
MEPLVDLETLITYLHPGFPGKVAVVGMGNRLRGDDGAGPELVQSLKEQWEKSDFCRRFPNERLFIDAGETPEDWLVRIVDLKPAVVIVVDAVELGAAVGAVAVLPSDALPENICLSTHRMPLRSLLRLWEENGIKALVLAIQPSSLEHGREICPQVREVIGHLTAILSGRED